MDEAIEWLRQRVRERLYLAQHTIELGNHAAWTEQSSGVLVTSEPTAGDTWHGTWAMGDSSLARLMEANDPQDTIARCEAELAIIDEFTSRHQDAYLMLGPSIARQREWEGLRLAVRLLASGYRHREGYAQHWGQG